MTPPLAAVLALGAADGRLLWNDFEDCCAGSPLLDPAVLARRCARRAARAASHDGLSRPDQLM